MTKHEKTAQTIAKNIMDRVMLGQAPKLSDYWMSESVKQLLPLYLPSYYKVALGLEKISSEATLRRQAVKREQSRYAEVS